MVAAKATGQEIFPFTAYQAPSTTSVSPGNGGNTYSMRLPRKRMAGAAGPVRASTSVRAATTRSSVLTGPW